MNNYIRNTLLLIFPFLLMVLLNESMRPTIQEKGYQFQGVKAINSALKIKTKCSWNCHKDSNYCKQNHVKLCSNYFAYTDPVYFGIINALASTGFYRVANVFFLVVLIPLFLYSLLIKSLDLQKQIEQQSANS